MSLDLLGRAALTFVQGAPGKHGAAAHSSMSAHDEPSPAPAAWELAYDQFLILTATDRNL